MGNRSPLPRDSRESFPECRPVIAEAEHCQRDKGCHGGAESELRGQRPERTSHAHATAAVLVVLARAGAHVAGGDLLPSPNRREHRGRPGPSAPPRQAGRSSVAAEITPTAIHWLAPSRFARETRTPVLRPGGGSSPHAMTSRASASSSPRSTRCTWCLFRGVPCARMASDDPGVGMVSVDLVRVGWLGWSAMPWSIRAGCGDCGCAIGWRGLISMAAGW